jgi:uncharacterized membrane protein YcaP (DUF421 family)
MVMVLFLQRCYALFPALVQVRLMGKSENRMIECGRLFSLIIMVLIGEVLR